LLAHQHNQLLIAKKPNYWQLPVAENGGKGVIGDTVKLSPIFLTGGIMSGIDFKSFLIGILITIIFVFTTGVTNREGGNYMVSCKQSHCLVLNTKTGAGRYVHENNMDEKWRETMGVRGNKFGGLLPKVGFMQQGVKPDF
jgi:hypothetical protein